MSATNLSSGTKSSLNRYSALIEKIFFDLYKKGSKSLAFERSDLKRAATALTINLPENLGDVIYSMRFRAPMPPAILKTQPTGSEWIIELAGRAKYRFRLVKKNRIVPNQNLVTTKIPDNTPEIISTYALDDEQALLAKVRYNRLIDIFLGLTTFSLQNHLRTTVKSIGQIEIDEVYVGMDKFGAHYMIPVQAKGGSDQISIVQTMQDIAWCEARFPHLKCRPISVQFVSSDQIAIFELTVEDEEVRVVDERHYRLVAAGDLDQVEISTYR
ncbi:endonuclease [Polaromonas sp. A23]|uniref:endonuclease n=1 Tax=Polaromonas sp. A23 TaxID=1944133 RepID=UPI000986C630|nr:endonuclease [Polaromonas sp. A23]OOG36061.1 endonuclease [Polaromonas sp. A23]